MLDLAAVSAESLQSVRLLYLVLKLGNSLRGDLVHVHGQPASGKAHLLYAFLITCITPSNANGWAMAAFVFDTDVSFDPFRFTKLLRTRLKRVLPFENTDALTTQSLKNLHIFRPTSASQLAASLLHLPVYHTRNFSDTPIGMIAIDYAFYWPDRFTAQLASASPQDPVSSTPFPPVLTALQQLRLALSPLTIFMNWDISTGRIQTLNSKDDSAIHHITLSSEPVQKLVPVEDLDGTEINRLAVQFKGVIHDLSPASFTLCVDIDDVSVT